jgi:hypothetical protein
MNPAFFMPGMTTTQRALSIRSWGIPRSEALIISVSVSAEASSLSSTLIALSAAKAAVLMVPAIARTQTLCLKFILITGSPFVFRFGSRVPAWLPSLANFKTEENHSYFGRSTPMAISSGRARIASAMPTRCM